MDGNEALAKKIASNGCLVKIPSKLYIEKFIEDLFLTLFPQGKKSCSVTSKEAFERLTLCKDLLLHITLNELELGKSTSEKVTEEFFLALNSTYEQLLIDAKAHFDRDPAARGVNEVILCYPGFKSIAIHRFSHTLYNLKVPLLPRVLSEYGHRQTGIDIHPGAQIGSNFVIDHGTSVVIGESTVIGDNVTLYQGVTLGALVVEKSEALNKRHPTIEDNVIIYANSTILGGDTVIGKDSIIGANCFITKSVATNSLVFNSKSSTQIIGKNQKKPVQTCA
jgi:serine O-acetyltransferase